MIQVTSKVSSKGQIVVPLEMRKQLDIKEGDSLKFTVKDNGDIGVEVIKRNSILDLFGSIQPHGDTSNFEKIRTEAKEERNEEIIRKINK